MKLSQFINPCQVLKSLNLNNDTSLPVTKGLDPVLSYSNDNDITFRPLTCNENITEAQIKIWNWFVGFRGNSSNDKFTITFKTIMDATGYSLITCRRAMKELQELGKLKRIQGFEMGYTVTTEKKGKMPDRKWYYFPIEEKIIYLKNPVNTGCENNERTINKNNEFILKKEDLNNFWQEREDSVRFVRKITNLPIVEILVHAIRFDQWCKKIGFILHDPEIQFLRFVESSIDRGIPNVTSFKNAVDYMRKSRKKERFERKLKDKKRVMMKQPKQELSIDGVRQAIAMAMDPVELQIFTQHVNYIDFNHNTGRLFLLSRFSMCYDSDRRDKWERIITRDYPEVKKIMYDSR